MTRFAAILTVTALAALAGTGCKKKPDIASGGGDQARFQGTWAVESYDNGEPLGPDDLAEAKQVRLKFEGDKATIFGEGKDDERFTFTLDEDKAPKVLTFTEVVGDSGPRGVTSSRGTAKGGSTGPETIVFIYKFEGDALVLAFRKGKSTEPPADFTPQATKFQPGQPVAGVTVITLKKTDAPPPPSPPRRSVTTTAAWKGTKK